MDKRAHTDVVRVDKINGAVSMVTAVSRLIVADRTITRGDATAKDMMGVKTEFTHYGPA